MQAPPLPIALGKRPHLRRREASMINRAIRATVAVFLTALTVSCSGSDSPSSPNAPTAPVTGSVSITVASLSATTERTPPGVTYHVTFTLRASGPIGATVTGLKVNLTNGTRSGAATFDNLSDQLIAGGTFDERLRITSTNETDLYDAISSVAVTYTDARGAVGSVNSQSASIAAPPAGSAPSPTPSPSPNPTCSYSLSPSALTLGATGSFTKATIQVTTTSTCAWTVAVADAWLNVTPPTGTGTGSIALEASSNVTPNGASRSTRLTLGNASVAVTQTGEATQTQPPVPSPIPASCNAGPYKWDDNVQRCRDPQGRFAPSACCGR
jgi:hypothetical protein